MPDECRPFEILLRQPSRPTRSGCMDWVCTTVHVRFLAEKSDFHDRELTPSRGNSAFASREGDRRWGRRIDETLGSPWENVQTGRWNLSRTCFCWIRALSAFRALSVPEHRYRGGEFP